MRTETIILALSSLAQEHRLAAFRLLIAAGPEGLAAGAIAAETGISASSMSFHLNHLNHAGLVFANRQGRSIVYTAHYPAIAAVIAYLTENCCGGAPCNLLGDDTPLALCDLTSTG